MPARRSASSCSRSATSGLRSALTRRYGVMRRTSKLASVANRCSTDASAAEALCSLPTTSPTRPAKAGSTSPASRAAFHSRWCCGGRYSMAKKPASASWASTRGQHPGTCSWAKVSHSYSTALRPTGANHSSATRNRGSAAFTHSVRPGSSTRHRSEDTPPVSGVQRDRSSSACRPCPTRNRRAAARRSWPVTTPPRPATPRTGGSRPPRSAGAGCTWRAGRSSAGNRS